MGMTRELRDRLERMVSEEEKSPVDTDLLVALRSLVAARDPLAIVQKMGPEQRNALNMFLTELRDFMIQETMRGEYGASIIADSTIVMAFEAGFKAATKTGVAEKMQGTL